MKTHTLIQGSPEWLAHRTQYFNASDAAAMMGCSPYKTRTQLLHEMHTGLTPDVDAGLQRRFDDGHRFEALARPLAEAIIGETLYPVVGSNGKYSASFDGLTMAEDTAFEHKTLNDELRACMRDEGNGYGLPLQYRVQMEQQLMVSGAERVLFMASKWKLDHSSEEWIIEESRHCWYASDLALAAQIDAGWEQFAIDLAAYVPAEVIEKPIGKTMEALPALRVEVTGMVTASNLTAYKEHAMAVFASINRELTTDQHFADAAKTVKWCEDVEGRLAAAKQHALSQTETIDALFRTIDEISAEARQIRLDLDKLVDKRKAEIKLAVIKKARDAYEAHVDALMKETGPWIVLAPPNWAEAAKNKRTIDSLQNAVDTALAGGKIAADASAKSIRASLAVLKEDGAGYESLFADRLSLIGKPLDDLKLLIKSRIDEQKVKNQKLIDDAAAAVKAAAELAAAPAPAPVANVAQIPTPQAAATRILAARLPEVKKTPPDLRLGQICERLGFNVTADFLRTLGFEPAGRDRAAVLYHESSYLHICDSLIEHIQFVRATVPA